MKCEQCGGDLPAGCRSDRRFCDACRLARQREHQRADPEYRERVRERQRERYRTDPEYRVRERERVRERQRERYRTDPEYRVRVRERQRERYRDPEYRLRQRERQRERQRQRWRDTEARRMAALGIDLEAILTALQQREFTR